MPTITLNSQGASHASSLISAGKVNKTASWSFSSSDGNKLLGSGKDDWTEYSRWFLGERKSSPEKTKDRFAYPFGKNGEVYRSAVTAVRQRAAQQGDSAVFAEAGKLLTSIDGQKCDDVPEVRAAIVGTIERRTFTIDRSAINKDTRTVSLAFSSETPVERWYGMETLDHKKGSVRMSRLTDGAPFLKDHDPRRQIGVIEKANIHDGDKIGRSDVRLSRSPDGEQELQDMEDGIRTKVSVGYRVHDIQLEREVDGVKYYRVTDWEPMEISSVAIPADNSVGVGRSQDLEADDRKIEEEVDRRINEILQHKESTKMPEPKTEQEILKEERQRVADIEAIAAKHVGRLANISDIRNKAMTEHWTVEQFRGAISEAYTGTDARVIEAPPSDLDLSSKDKRSYSLLRLIQSKLPDSKIKAEFEEECSREIEKRVGKSPQGDYIPWDIQNRNLSVSVGSQQELDRLRLLAITAGLKNAARALDSTSTSGAKELVGTDLRADLFVELLRNKAVAGRVGVQILTGLVGNLSIPRQTGAATFEWTGESGSTSGSALTTGSLSLSPKEGRAFQEYTRMLLLQSSPSIEMLVQNDLLTIARLGVDKAVFHGLGSSNQPKGIALETGIGSVDGSNLGWDEIVDLESDVEAANADVDTMFYVTNATIKGLLKKRTVVPNYPDHLMDKDGTVNGRPAIISNQISSGYLFFGDFSQELCGYWGSMDLLVNPFAKDKDGITRINIFVDVDCVLRQVGAIAASSNVA